MERHYLPTHQPIVLTIATSDSGGNAGIQADLKTFTALDTYGATVIVGLTAQNPNTVSHILPIDPQFTKEQLRQVFDYYPIKAIKTGMLINSEIIHTIASFLENYKNTIPLVVDPVMIASSGTRLLEESAIDALKNHLLPLATLITPNLNEAIVLTQEQQIPATHEVMLKLLEQLIAQYSTNILLKGGHLESDTITDLLGTVNGSILTFHTQRIHNINTHGSGCTLSAAITAYLAQGLPLHEAVKNARVYLRETMLNPFYIQEEAFIHHAQSTFTPRSR